MKTLGTPDFCSLCCFNLSCLSVFRRPSIEDRAVYSVYGSRVVLVTLQLPKKPLAYWHAVSQGT